MHTVAFPIDVDYAHLDDRHLPAAPQQVYLGRLPFENRESEGGPDQLVVAAVEQHLGGAVREPDPSAAVDDDERVGQAIYDVAKTLLARLKLAREVFNRLPRTVDYLIQRLIPPNPAPLIPILFE